MEEKKKSGIGLIIAVSIVAIVCAILIWSTFKADKIGSIINTDGISVTMVDDSTYHINLTEGSCVTLQKSKDTLIAYPVGCCLCYANFEMSDTVFVIITNPPVKNVTEYSFHLSYHDYFPDDDLKYFKKVDRDQNLKDVSGDDPETDSILKVLDEAKRREIEILDQRRDSIDKMKRICTDQAELESQILKGYAKEIDFDSLEEAHLKNTYKALNNDSINVVKHGADIYVIRPTEFLTISLKSDRNILFVATVGANTARVFEGSPLIMIIRKSMNGANEYYCIDYREFFDRDFDRIVVNSVI